MPCLINNEAWLHHLAHENNPPKPASPNAFAQPASPLPSTPTLARKLPTSSHLNTLAQKEAHSSRRRHILQDSLSTALETPLDAFPVPAADESKHNSSRHVSNSSLSKMERRPYWNEMGKSKTIEPFQVLRAIEKKNLFLLSEIRTQQFELLLNPIGGVTPLVRAMRLGDSHKDVAIMLTGALSRRVNDLTDSELENSSPETKTLLRSIRANLKIAIQAGIQAEDTTLLASFLQVILMSEGDKWLVSSTHKISLAIRSGPSGKPVASAQQLVEKWASRELLKSQIAAVEEYVANAVGDLVLFGLWSVATDSIPAEPIPLYFFARDDRVTKALEERVQELKRGAAYNKLSKQLRSQLETALDAMSKRNLGGRERILNLKKLLDQP